MTVCKHAISHLLAAPEHPFFPHTSADHFIPPYRELAANDSNSYRRHAVPGVTADFHALPSSGTF